MKLKEKNLLKQKMQNLKLSSAKEDPLSFNTFLEQIFTEFIDNNKDKLDNKKGQSITNAKGKKKGKCC